MRVVEHRILHSRIGQTLLNTVFGNLLILLVRVERQYRCGPVLEILAEGNRGATAKLAARFQHGDVAIAQLVVDERRRIAGADRLRADGLPADAVRTDHGPASGCPQQSLVATIRIRVVRIIDEIHDLVGRPARLGIYHVEAIVGARSSDFDLIQRRPLPFQPILGHRQRASDLVGYPIALLVWHCHVEQLEDTFIGDPYRSGCRLHANAIRRSNWSKDGPLLFRLMHRAFQAFHTLDKVIVEEQLMLAGLEGNRFGGRDSRGQHQHA